MKLYRFVIGVTAALLLLAVNIRSAGQQPADTRQTADTRAAAAPAASPTAAVTRAPTEDEFQAVGIPPTISWLQLHAETGG